MDNRRLGERVQPDNLTVLWCTPGTKVGAWRASRRPLEVSVIDLSFSGLQLIAPQDDRIQRGTTLEVVLREISAEVRVRWARPAAEPPMLVYGLELLRQTPELEAVIKEVMVECHERDGIPVRDEPTERRTIW